MTRKQKHTPITCGVCQHDMSRSRVRFLKDGGSRLYQLLTTGGEVTCNKCKTVHTVRATFPDQQKLMEESRI